MAEITSAYEAYEALPGLTWDDIFDATDLVNQAIDERSADSTVRNLLFSQETTPGVTVGWRTDVPAGDPDSVETLAEFAEAPVIDPTKGAEGFSKLKAVGASMRVSYEQTKLNAGAAVQREINHMVRTIEMHDSRQALNVFNAAIDETDPLKKVDSIAAAAPLTDPNAVPLDDFLKANELIMGAEIDGIQFGYIGDTFWTNPVTAARLRNHVNIRDLYVGNMASENPMFNPGLATIAGQFAILEDPTIPVGEGFLFQGGDVSGSTIGTEYVWQDGAGEVSAFYADGDTSRGGRTRSFRADYSKWNAMALRAPKAIVKITGLV